MENIEELELDELEDEPLEEEKFTYEVWASGISKNSKEKTFEVYLKSFEEPLEAINFANLVDLEHIDSIRSIPPDLETIQITVDSTFKTQDCGTVYKTELVNI